MTPFSATGENTVVQFLHWLAENPANLESILVGRRPIHFGVYISETVASIVREFCLLSMSHSVQTSIICLAVPKSKLCIGSTTCMRTILKYGIRKSTEYLTPYWEIRFFCSCLVLAYVYSDANRWCSVSILGSHKVQSYPEKSSLFSNAPDGNIFMHFEHPHLALCPANPHSFLTAGISQQTQT